MKTYYINDINDVREKEYGAYTIVRQKPTEEEIAVVAQKIQETITSCFANPKIITKKTVVIDCDADRARPRPGAIDPLDPAPPPITLWSDVPAGAWSIGVVMTMCHDGEKYLLKSDVYAPRLDVEGEREENV